MKKFIAALCGLLLSIAPASAENVLRWASQGDALTFDPHAQNEGQTLTMLQQVYEPLVERRADESKQPSLALSWRMANPTTWEFKLRPNVKFHDGRPFTSADVVFSFKRALSPTSDMRQIIGTITDVVAVDPLTVHIKTRGPDPILPDEIYNTFMMSKSWAEEHGVAVPQDFAKSEETYAVRHGNGTGSFMLELREPDVRTVMVKNPNWWGLTDADEMVRDTSLNVDRVIFTPIANAATRIAALLSGELEFVLDPPLQDLARLQANPDLQLQRIPETRPIFIGMNAGRKELASSSVKGKNPFADIRVRKALNMAVNEDAIVSRIMRGVATPAGHIVPVGIPGYDKELDQRLPFDPDGAKKLLAEAGYPDGFDVRLDCPNDRYINDQDICQAIVPMLARVGVKVTLDLKPRSLHLPKILNNQTDFYLLGWGVDTQDSQSQFVALALPESDWNRTGYNDETMFKLVRDAAVEIDLKKREAMLLEASKRMKEAYPYITLHHQVLVWATRKGWEIPIQSENMPQFRLARYVGK